MLDADLAALLPALETFHARFGRFFRRSEGRAASRKYLIGLALPIERKNVENIAERVGAPPRKLQEFLSDSPWVRIPVISNTQSGRIRTPSPGFSNTLPEAGRSGSDAGRERPRWVTSFSY
jgi:hypothetical protein